MSLVYEMMLLRAARLVLSPLLSKVLFEVLCQSMCLSDVVCSSPGNTPNSSKIHTVPFSQFFRSINTPFESVRAELRKRLQRSGCVVYVYRFTHSLWICLWRLSENSVLLVLI